MLSKDAVNKAEEIRKLINKLREELNEEGPLWINIDVDGVRIQENTNPIGPISLSFRLGNYN